MTESSLSPACAVGTTKKPRKVKPPFYHTRQKIIPNVEQAAKVLGCSVDDIQRWDIEGNDLAEKYLKLWDSKHISEPGWSGFVFTRGVLKYKNRRWSPQSLIDAKNDSIRIPELEMRIHSLCQEVKSLKEQLPSTSKIDLSTRFRGRDV